MSRRQSEHQATQSRRSREHAYQGALASPRAREPKASRDTNCSRQEVNEIPTRRVKASIDRRGPVSNETNVPQGTHPSLSKTFCVQAHTICRVQERIKPIHRNLTQVSDFPSGEKNQDAALKGLLEV